MPIPSSKRHRYIYLGASRFITANGIDSTKIFSKFFVSFNEDETCAEVFKFDTQLTKIYGVWEIFQYADGTSITFWVPKSIGFENIDGEWYFNELSNKKIHLFRTNEKNENQELIFIR